MFSRNEIDDLFERDANNFITRGKGLAQNPAITFLGSFDAVYSVDNDNVLYIQPRTLDKFTP